MSGTTPTNEIEKVLRHNLDGIPPELARRIALECVAAYSKAAHRRAVAEVSYPLVSEEKLQRSMYLQYAEARLEDVRRSKSKERARISLIEAGRTIVLMLADLDRE